MSRGTGAFRMVPLGERGPNFRPEHDYFSVALVAIHLPGKGFGTQKFAPVVWSSIKHIALEGEKTLVGVFPPANADQPDFARKDRIQVIDLQLTPRIIAREELTFDFTLGMVKEKDYLAGALKLAGELASSPAASFVSQIAPAAAVAKTIVHAADRVLQVIGELLDTDKLKSLGRYAGTLRTPLASGLIAFTDSHEEVSGLNFDVATNQLVNSGGPLKAAYVVLRLQCETTRPDWMLLPDLNQAWVRIRDAALNGGDIVGAIEYFRLTALTSPDLTRVDAKRLVEAAQQKFAPVLAGAESADGDPGDMAESLSFFLEDAENFTLPAAARTATTMAMPVAFNRALEMVLAHEGGFVDHPADPGGATNRGVTQATYDAYRKRKGIPKRSVKDITVEELKEIYFNGYWRPAMCPEMPNEALATLMFDAAVNHGPAQAIKFLQQASAVPAAQCDGKWGPVTRTRVIAAAANISTLIDECLLQRERFYRLIVERRPQLGAFLRGWMNRIVSLRAYVKPLLIRAPAGVDSESALFGESPDREVLRAAPPDFSLWEIRTKDPDTIAAQ
jgi:lysozyme family protein